MEFQKLLYWIESQKDDLDGILEKTSYEYYNSNKHFDNLIFDINTTNNECYALSGNKDLCYDRPTIGFTYSLWYHGRRVNTFLKYFAEVIYEARHDENITLFDLGAGTGAVQWAAGLVYCGMKSLNIPTPSFKIVNIDTSPFMLDYNRTYLWSNFIKIYPEVLDFEIEYSLNSWNQSQRLKHSNIWITASYLFDHSENKDDLTLGFMELLQNFAPKKILLLSSYNKSYLTNDLADLLNENNYHKVDLKGELVFNGTMSKVFRARNKFKDTLNIKFSGTPTWHDRALVGSVLESTSPIFDIFSGQESKNTVNLYNPPITVRRDIILNNKQRDAAKHDGRPTVITGPAGCGKSVVITERVINIVEESIKANRINKLSILVTTFNKELKAYLIKWLTDILDSKNIKYVISKNGIRIEDSQFANIAIMHFDVLPTRIWKAKSINDYPFASDQLQFDAFHKRITEVAIQNVKSKNIITTSEYDNVLNADYVLDEYHRIIYGNDYSKEEIYLTSIRQGRPRLEYNGIRRKLLFKTVIEYLRILEEKKYSSIITRRNKFLKKLNSGTMNGIFEYIFVDEFQDCTQSDYTIFYRLIKNPNNLVIAGDYAQAVHLGKVADIPRDNDETTERMKNRKYHRLKGSYRLPYRISEAIKPISNYIASGSDHIDIITPYKGAPPGARPILVYAEEDVQMADKVSQIIRAYKLFDIIDLKDQPIRNITILEKDFPLQNKLSNKQLNIASTDTILRLKGMEKTCILWSTRIEIIDKDEIFEFVYTIMTRTSGLLIISLFPNTITNYIDIINKLRKDRVIIWDNKTKQHLMENYEYI
ncbi:UvrD-helicase domain-containing protein [uncultured Psychroserpens sp.]|uniref:UvrD-helicase domain-containing protein n=1 Tax=uncultured Psychroserpens sp. TaxID=255436 RepID=UPI0026203B84|nr:UvrD-helicase domain-containing protein [uncultured Psychroserpens sp.]